MPDRRRRSAIDALVGRFDNGALHYVGRGPQECRAEITFSKIWFDGCFETTALGYGVWQVTDDFGLDVPGNGNADARCRA